MPSCAVHSLLLWEVCLTKSIRTSRKLNLTSAFRALQNPELFKYEHYRQAALAVCAGILIRFLIAVPVSISFTWTGRLLVDCTIWDYCRQSFSVDDCILCRFWICNLGWLFGRWVAFPRPLGAPSSFFPDDNDEIHFPDTRSYVRDLRLKTVASPHQSRFMDSLKWVDQTYIEKHKSEDRRTLRAMYYPNLQLYSAHGDVSRRKSPKDAALAFFMRYGRRAAISLLLYILSFLPVVGRFVLPAASFYALNKALGPVPASIIFGSGVFVPRRYLVVFLQSYFSSRSLMRELVGFLWWAIENLLINCLWR